MSNGCIPFRYNLLGLKEGVVLDSSSPLSREDVGL